MRQRQQQRIRIPHGAQYFICQGNPLLIGEPVEIWNLGGPHERQSSHTVRADKSAPFQFGPSYAIGRQLAHIAGDSAVRAAMLRDETLDWRPAGIRARVRGHAGFPGILDSPGFPLGLKMSVADHDFRESSRLPFSCRIIRRVSPSRPECWNAAQGCCVPNWGKSDPNSMRSAPNAETATATSRPPGFIMPVSTKMRFRGETRGES